MLEWNDAKRKSSVHHLRTSECIMHVKKVGGHISKLTDRSTPMIFIGYESGSKAYRAYDPTTSKMCLTRDVISSPHSVSFGLIVLFEIAGC